MAGDFDAYLRALRQTPLAEHTEHTGRSALEALLNGFAASAGGAPISVQHEPKRIAGTGAPDFKIKRKGMILGYAENKEIGTNLDKVLKSDQIARYCKLSSNILITDYLQWLWIDGDRKVKARATLAYPTDLEGRKIRVNPERAAETANLISAFFSEAPQGIGRSQTLALALAARSQLLREFLAHELTRQSKEHREGRLHALYGVFKAQIFHELSIAEFSDAFAQMLAYGLFLARLNAGAGKTVTLGNVREHIPGSFRLIRELVRFIEEMTESEYAETLWVVEEILSIVNGLDLAAIQEDLSFRQRKAVSRKVEAKSEEEHRLFERDPFIYFYEDYLKAYDAAMRKGRGVYYTPPPVVNFIVRAIDDILKDKFGMEGGLANTRVTVLDFACGTGTFLLEVFNRIFENIGGADSARADLIAREHLTKNLYGFEYLIAPYTIAHLKLSQYLKERGHELKDGERLQVFLTNTLEPVTPEPDLYFPAVTAEVADAQKVKDKPILVITGNPPYSGHSKNKGAWITEKIAAYKKVDGKPLGEKNPKWLNDDYVKFIRFAQVKMDKVDEGIVGIITSHSWLDNPTFRGMRKSLMDSFEQIYVLDLHGNAKKKERAPDGGKDENVFDIEQGVAISLFVKKKGLERGVWRGDLWGKRIEKYKAAASAEIGSREWKHLKPDQPFYLFEPQNIKLRSEYSEFLRIPELFEVSVLGFQTHRDDFAIAFTESEMKRRIQKLRDTSVSDQTIRDEFGVKDNRDWTLSGARNLSRVQGSSNLIAVAYRPFDERFAEFSHIAMDRPRRELMEHVANRENLTLQLPRQVRSSDWRHALVAAVPAESCQISAQSREGNYNFPIWQYAAGEKKENFTETFRDFLDARYGSHFNAEEILGYIYAVLHAPAYRKRYAEFLRIDFPRIPFAGSAADFKALSALGTGLVNAHLIKGQTRGRLAEYHGKGSHEVEAVRYSPAEQAVWINQAQRFAPVRPEVWEFFIGGYQVVEKYLKSRKGRKLSLDEINHFGHIADSLAFTIRQMQAIDAAYLKAFPGRG